jgi:hypothetical protein
MKETSWHTCVLLAILIAIVSWIIGFGCGMDAIRSDLKEDCADLGKTRIHSEVYTCSPVGKTGEQR